MKYLNENPLGEEIDEAKINSILESFNSEKESLNDFLINH